MTRIVIIGGVAAGMSAASQAKRRNPGAEVIVLERGHHVSYGACGMPYNLQDPGRDIQDLVVIRAERFREERGIDVRLRHEALSINCAALTVAVRDHEGRDDYTLTYDRLVIATGASPFVPALEGMDLPGVFRLRDLDDGAAIKAHLAERRPQSAVIIGGGYIGMEMADVLRSSGLSVTVLERAAQLLPGFDKKIAGHVALCLQQHGVAVHTGVNIAAIRPVAGGLRVQADTGQFAADLVLVSVGIRPNVALAVQAGIVLGESGAIAVDAGMRTSAPDVYAAGDCAEAWHRVLNRPVYIPLGTTANKQGKIAGANATGADERFAGIVGSAAFAVFELEVGRTGLGAADIERAGLRAITALSTHKSRGHRFPGSHDITTLVYAERGSRRLLGAQMVGEGTVAKRIDIFATALQAGMTVDEVAALDLSYAPPVAPVYDPVLIAATVAQKALRD